MSDDTTTVNSEPEERGDEEREPGSTRSDAQDLGDITGVDTPRERDGQVGVDGDAVAYYRFTLTQAREVRLGLAHREGDADLYLEDASGAVLGRAVDYAPGWEAVVRTLDAGTYYVRVEAQGTEPSAHQFVVLTKEPYAAYASLGTIVQVLGLPSFGESSYAFALSEHADGSETGVSLGTVGATDPDGDVLHYSLVGGNDSGLFAIDASSGEVFYVGTGEDFESGAGPYELTVRASDGTHTIDTTVTVTVTDVAEAPSFVESSYAFALAENVDGSETGVSLGTVSATDPDGDALHYSLVGGNDSGLFALDETSGELFYVGSGEDFESGVGPYELTVRASDGTHTIDATVTVTVTDVAEAPSFTESSYAFALSENVDGSETRVSLGTVQAADPEGDTVGYNLVGGNESGLFALDAVSGEVFYVGPGEDFESGAGPYELTVRAGDGTHVIDATVTVTVTDTAEAPSFLESSYAFALSENADGSETRLSLGTMAATDPDGDAVRYTLEAGNESGLFALDESSGELSYVGPGEDYEGGAGPYELTVRAGDGTHVIDATVTVTITDTPEALVFSESSYAFALSENADGSETRLSLGTVSATDPEGDSLRYSLVGGNESGLFAIDEASGEVFYVGAGEDYESGAGPYKLTVRASDGTHTVDAAIAVTVTDAAEAPVFGEADYRFDLPENMDGSETRVSFGRVEATDPEGGPVRYSLVGGNVSGLFAIDETGGELFYLGSEKDLASGAEPYELTIRATDGTHTVDATATVTVTEAASAAEKAEARQGDSEPAGQDLPATRSTGGEVLVDAEAVQGTLRSSSDRDWFAVTLAPGRTYVFNLQGDVPVGGTTPVIRGLRDSNGNPVPGIENGPELRYTTDEAAAEAVYYVEVGGEGDFTQGTRATGGGFGPLSAGIAPRSSNYYVVCSYWLWANDVTETSDAEDDHPAGTNTNATVEVGSTATGEIERPGDRDWFAVTLQSDKSYRIDLEGRHTSKGTLWDPYLYGIHDSNGNPISGTTNDDGGAGNNSRLYFSPEANGTYYIAAGAYRNRTGTYRVSVSEINNDDYLAGTGTSGTVAVGGSAKGEIERAGDRDWFEVTLEAGKRYRIDLEGTYTSAGTLRDPYLRGVHDQNGNLISGTTDDDGGLVRNSRLYFRAETAGLHYIAAGASRGHTGTYRVSVRDVGDDDHPGSTDTSSTVAVGGSARGTIESPHDQDWFMVTLEEGKIYRIDLMARSTTRGTLRSPYLHGVHDTSGDPIPGTSNDDGGFLFDSRLYFHAETTGIHYIAAGSSQNSTGTYRVYVKEITDAHSAGTDNAGTVTVGGSATGGIDYPGDYDWFAVDLEAGKSYYIDLEGRHTSAGTLWNPHIHRIYDAEGDPIPGTTDNDGGHWFNSRLLFEPDTTGTYYVAAAARPIPFVNGLKLVGTYRLSVRETIDDYPAGADNAGTVTVGGSATGDIERPFDRDWFSVTLEEGKSYRIDLEGGDTSAGTLRDPYIRGIYDTNGNYISGTRNNDGGVGENSRLHFEPDTTGTYYIAAGAYYTGTGTYELSVEEVL